MDKKYELEILTPAQEELEEIAGRRMTRVGAVSARKITERIYENLENLCFFPNMGVLCKDKELRLQGFRILICDEYLCLYRLISKIVFVYHIVDGRRDYPLIFADALDDNI